MRVHSFLWLFAAVFALICLGQGSHAATRVVNNSTVVVTIPANTPTTVTASCEVGYTATHCTGVSQVAYGVEPPHGIRPPQMTVSGRSCTGVFTQPFAYVANQWSLVVSAMC